MLVLLLNLQLGLFFGCNVAQSFNTKFMRRFIMSSIMVYYTIIILNILTKVADYINLEYIMM